MSPQFGTLYVKFGRPSIPPEKKLGAAAAGAYHPQRAADGADR
jgi:hypothetical protein